MTMPMPRASLAAIGTSMAPILGAATAGAGRLCSNENPLGPSPHAIAAASAALARGHEYPEGEGDDLIAAIAAHYGAPAANIRIGSGSDTLMMHAVLAFAGPGDEVVFSARGYSRYGRNALIAGATPVPAPDDDFRADPDGILAALTPRTRVVMIANPDNPSGAMLRLDDIMALHARLPGDVLLVLDGAYADYVRDPAYGDGGLALSARADNVLVSRTFSKFYGMAGMRLGWLAGSPHLLAAIGKVGPTFPVAMPALAAGRAALADIGHQQASRAHNDHWLRWLTETLGRCKGIRVRPSQANFLLLDLPSPAIARDCVAHLAAHGILVRGFSGPAHAHQLRISIGNGQMLSRAAPMIASFVEQGG